MLAVSDGRFVGALMFLMLIGFHQMAEAVNATLTLKNDNSETDMAILSDPQELLFNFGASCKALCFCYSVQDEQHNTKDIENLQGLHAACNGFYGKLCVTDETPKLVFFSRGRLLSYDEMRIEEIPSTNIRAEYDHKGRKTPHYKAKLFGNDQCGDATVEVTNVALYVPGEPAPEVCPACECAEPTTAAPQVSTEAEPEVVPTGAEAEEVPTTTDEA
ncbi:hypothetical protein M3Y98_00901500 [Aphelenchoides besseyi]|nr:hypothetical protein M3Y98_00901500 [Aphelenchoides besseyi]KAI6193617.1 hypothetical protein M3Y96_01037700 [Aphelenchoides besseyi]